MKKLAVAAVVLCLAAMLSGCMGDMSVEDMLTAPALTADQSAVMAEIEAQSSEKTMLKYPMGGERRAPIQFVDLDGDGANEAVVFYSVPVSDVYAYLAVLQKNEAGEWKTVSTLKGAGTDVESISVVRLATAGSRFLLVEWSSKSKSAHQIAAYNFTGHEISLGFEEACSDILVYDLNNDDFNEFCYITEGSTTEPFKLKYVGHENGEFAVRGEVRLSNSMLDSVSITAGELADGKKALFVDENVGDGVLATEVFTLAGEELERADYAEGFDVSEVSRRPLESLACRRMFGTGKIYIPSAVAPFEGVMSPEHWTYWYTINNGEIAYVKSTYVNTEYNMSVAVPDKWLGISTVGPGQTDPRMFTIYDTAGASPLVIIKVVLIGENSASFSMDGFRVIDQSGSYRYFIKGFCSSEDLKYIIDNFELL